MRVFSVWAATASWSVALAASIPASYKTHQKLSDASPDAAGNDTLPSVGGKAFSLALTENVRFKGMDGPAEMIKVHAKYGGSLNRGLSDAFDQNPELRHKFKIYLQQGDSTGTVPALPPEYFDVQYVAPVLIGTPPQETFLNLDTGSADFWTFSTDTYRPHVRLQTQYRPEDSSTSKLLRGEAWNIRYGDGAGASGIVYQDRVQVGNTSFDSQAVQAAVQVSSAISDDQFASGILGLGISASNTVRPTKQKTYIDNIKNDLARPLFTANLKKGVPGTYNFGYLDKTEYRGRIGYADLDPYSLYWQITLDGYQVGANGTYGDYKWDAIVDTGTSLLLLPDVMVDYYYSQVEGARLDRFVGMMVFPCDAELPDFIFQVGDYKGTVPGHYMNYGPSSRSGNTCHGGIQSADGVPFAILGDVLLKSQFVVFDVGEGRVGFAAKRTEPPQTYN